MLPRLAADRQLELAERTQIPEKERRMSQNSPELDHLLRSCQDGNERGWTDLYQQFGEQVARWLARLDYAVNEQDIQDLVVEVFLKVFRALPNYRVDECPFRAWLYQQTESVAIDNLRKRAALKRKPPGGIVNIESGESQSLAAVDPADEGAPPDEIAAQKETHQMLFKALDALGPPESRCRQLIAFVYFGGFTYYEVGQTLQMKAKTVSSALSKCMAELREVAAKIFSTGGE
jgi:RNA polymerase sigma factor (sigma-70 family)